MRLNQRGFSILGMLVKIALLLLVYYLITRGYFYLIFRKDTRDFLGKEGIKAVSVEGMVESVKDKVEDINKAFAQQEKDVENIFKKAGR